GKRQRLDFAGIDLSFYIHTWNKQVFLLFIFQAGMYIDHPVGCVDGLADHKNFRLKTGVWLIRKPKSYRLARSKRGDVLFKNIKIQLKLVGVYKLHSDISRRKEGAVDGVDFRDKSRNRGKDRNIGT